MLAAEDTPPARDELRSTTRFRQTLVAIGGIIASTAALVAVPDWPTALVIALLIAVTVVLVLSTDKRLRELYCANAQQAVEIGRCRGEHQQCREDVHSRDILLAMFCVHLKHGGQRPAGDRRERPKFPSELEVAFERTVGAEKAPTILEQARRLLDEATA